MAKPALEQARLPPPSEGECWLTFWKWVLGVPLVVGAALGFVWLAFWATGGSGMSWQLESNTAMVLFWLAVIALLYPVMLWVWWGDLRDGLKAARTWAAMSPEAHAAALVEAEALSATPKKRSRKQG